MAGGIKKAGPPLASHNRPCYDVPAMRKPPLRRSSSGYALLRLILPIALLLAILAPGPAQTQAPAAVFAQPSNFSPQPSAFGMNTYFTGLERINRDGDAGAATLIAQGRAIGVEWAREELSWGNIERSARGRWDWNPFDRRLREAAEAGYQIIGMLLTTPAWARVADCPARMARYAAAGVRVADYWCPPADPQDFAAYVAAVVERYDGDGYRDAPGSPRVAAWQIGNEPNAWETWPGTPAEYAALLELGYAAAKAADPSAIVATGGLYVFDGGWDDGIGHRDGLSFLADALEARPSAWRSFDALVVHPYMPTAAPDAPGLYGAVSLWGRLSMARAWLDAQTARRGGPPRPLWISELGWSTCTAAESDCFVGGAALSDRSAGAALPDWRLSLGPAALRAYDPPSAALQGADLAGLVGKSEEQQANYLVRSYGIALALGVEQISWFQLEDKFDGAARNFWEEAAIFRTAAQGYAPKPAAVAYGVLTGQLAGARFVGFGPLHSFQHNPGDLNDAARFHLRFRSADNRLIDLLWRNLGTETVMLPLEPGTGAALVARNGLALAVPVEAGAARLELSEAPLYLRQSTPPALGLSPEALRIMARPADSPQLRGLSVFNLGSGALSWSASSGAAWLRVEPTTGAAHISQLRLIADPAGLPPGLHQASLRIMSDGGSRDLPVQLLISPSITRFYMPIMAR
jgi:hypothetical protein